MLDSEDSSLLPNSSVIIRANNKKGPASLLFLSSLSPIVHSMWAWSQGRSVLALDQPLFLLSCLGVAFSAVSVFHPNATSRVSLYIFAGVLALVETTRTAAKMVDFSDYESTIFVSISLLLVLVSFASMFCLGYGYIKELEKTKEAIAEAEQDGGSAQNSVSLSP